MAKIKSATDSELRVVERKRVSLEVIVSHESFQGFNVWQ